MNEFSNEKEVGDKKQGVEQLEKINRFSVKYDEIVKKSKTKIIIISILVLILIILCVYFGYKYFEKQDEIFGETFQEDYEKQLGNSEIKDMFSSPSKMAMAPSSGVKEVRIGSDEGFGFMIRNLLTKEAGLNASFSYEVSAFRQTRLLDRDDLGSRRCDLSIDEIESWISSEKKDEDIQISISEPYVKIVSLRIPEDAPSNCTVTYLVKIWADDEPYDLGSMTIKLNKNKEEKTFGLESLYFVIFIAIIIFLLILVILIFF